MPKTNTENSPNTKTWTITNACAITLASGLTFWTNNPIYIISTASISFIILLFFLSSNFFFGNINYPNIITFLRFLILCWGVLYFDMLTSIQAFFLFGFAIFLDGVDGWLAKRFKQQSEIGALFDKTADAFFVLSFCYILVAKYGVSYLMLSIGCLHYIYEIIIYSLAWQEVQIPKNPIGRYVAAFLFLSLLSPFILPVWVYNPILLLSSLLTIISFGFSFWFKIKASRGT